MNTHRLFDCIEQFDTITIFRHISPDADALGSQFGLKTWILDNYPNKSVYALGNEQSNKTDVFPQSDECSDEQIANSLAIVLDTSTKARVDDSRFINAKYILIVDHHLNAEEFANESIRDDLFGATCEVLGYALMENNKSISKTSAQYLYTGLIADTLRFSIPTCNARTLQVGAYLLQSGVDVARANDANFSTPLKMYRFENYIRGNLSLVDDCFAYKIVNREDYEQYGLTFNEAKDKVFVMSGVDEIKSWALFTEKEQDENGNPLYNGSLRSKNIQINDIAEQYHGGGHRFACGVKGLSLDDIQTLIQKLVERIK